MGRYKRVHETIKTINIAWSKHKQFLFHLRILYTQFYPGYRFNAQDEGDKDFKEIIFHLTFNRKIEQIQIRFGIFDDRSLPF